MGKPGKPPLRKPGEVPWPSQRDGRGMTSCHPQAPLGLGQADLPFRFVKFGVHRIQRSAAHFSAPKVVNVGMSLLVAAP